MTTKDCIEIYYVKSRKGWRFRMIQKGESILISNGLYESAETALRVAKKFNADAYLGQWKVRTAR